jgi:hypothetical protein
MTDAHETTPQADAPPVMVAIGADLIREAVECLKLGITETRHGLRKHLEAYGPRFPRVRFVADEYEAEIARMEATAKALAEALPGGGA